VTSEKDTGQRKMFSQKFWTSTFQSLSELFHSFFQDKGAFRNISGRFLPHLGDFSFLGGDGRGSFFFKWRLLLNKLQALLSSAKSAQL